MALFSYTNIAVLLISLLVARRTYWEATTGQRRRRLASQKGTLPATQRVSRVPSYIPTFGIDAVVDNFRAIKAKRFLEKWQQDFIDAGAHTLAFNVFGASVYMTEDPENVKYMLATGFDAWSLGKERIKSMSAFLGMGIFTNEGKAWKHSREMLRPCFEKHAVADVSLLEKHVSRFVQLLPEDDRTIDLQPLLHELTLDIATEFLFGRSTDSLVRGEKSKDAEGFVHAFEYCCDPFLSKPYKKWGYVGLFLPDAEGKRCAQAVKDFADKIIDEEIASKSAEDRKNNNRYIFLDELLSATQDRTVIRSELLNILLAGRDTTASLLSNLLFELPRHPEVLSHLHAEILEHVGATSTPTYEQLKNMKYLKAIINESQRLHPIVPSNSREAIYDTTLPRGGGPDGTAPILIPAGTFVAYHVYSLHRRPDIYGPDAAEFRPERWLEPGFRPGWAFIPFSGGPRVCIGQNFALTEVMYVVVRMVQGYAIESRDKGVWRERMSITCVGDGGCKVGLKRRIDGGESGKL
ncbi:cytochrome P450 alkane hydroxylase [Ophiobolus disseminans]|uniref:Cytochrome P450 alkane hydroxylase n=1 Tax=Ophiobolus disseminans TaxID=1469910 RepID=A0A6A7A8N0_9PLEO|nr:cytochrome P450 alkane hydroxylase [Ophiobolus disseminans]